MSVQFGLDRPVVTLLTDVNRSHQTDHLVRLRVPETGHGSLHHRTGGARAAKGDEIGDSGFVSGGQRHRAQGQPQPDQQSDPNRNQTFFPPDIEHLAATAYKC